MEGHRQRRRELDEPAQPHLVHAAVGKQQPDDDAVRARRLERVQVRLVMDMDVVRVRLRLRVRVRVS